MRFCGKVMAGMMINFPSVESKFSLPHLLYYIINRSSFVSINKNLVYIMILRIKLFIITKCSNITTAAEYRVLLLHF